MTRVHLNVSVICRNIQNQHCAEATGPRVGCVSLMRALVVCEQRQNKWLLHVCICLAPSLQPNPVQGLRASAWLSCKCNIMFSYALNYFLTLAENSDLHIFQTWMFQINTFLTIELQKQDRTHGGHSEVNKPANKIFLLFLNLSQCSQWVLRTGSVNKLSPAFFLFLSALKQSGSTMFPLLCEWVIIQQQHFTVMSPKTHKSSRQLSFNYPNQRSHKETSNMFSKFNKCSHSLNTHTHTHTYKDKHTASSCTLHLIGEIMWVLVLFEHLVLFTQNYLKRRKCDDSVFPPGRAADLFIALLAVFFSSFLWLPLHHIIQSGSVRLDRPAAARWWCHVTWCIIDHGQWL